MDTERVQQTELTRSLAQELQQYESNVTQQLMRERQILVLLYVHHLQGAEIGRILGVSESRVSQLLSGIRRVLKERIDAYDSGSTPRQRRAA